MHSKKKKLEVFRRTGLYPVISPGFTLGRPMTEIMFQLADAGTELVQLRMKTESSLEIFREAEKFKKICSKHNILLIIDDRPDVAIACGADGVHLGQDDIPHEIVAKFAKELIIGASTHSLEEALEAERKGADYINIGPIFKTGTKKTGFAPLGISRFAKIAKKIRIPFTVMGGIKSRHLPRLIQAGAKKIAMVTEISESYDVKAKFIELQSICRNSEYDTKRRPLL